MIDNEIYDRLMDWARQTFNTGRDDLMNFEYEVQHQGLGELVQGMMAEAWWEGVYAQWENRPLGSRVLELHNPYRKLIENENQTN